MASDRPYLDWEGGGGEVREGEGGEREGRKGGEGEREKGGGREGWRGGGVKWYKEWNYYLHLLLSLIPGLQRCWD